MGQPGSGCSSLPKRPGVFQLWLQTSCHLKAQAVFPCVAKPVVHALQQEKEHILWICLISHLEVRFGGRSPGPGIPHPSTGSVKALTSYYFLLLFNIVIDNQIFMVSSEWNGSVKPQIHKHTETSIAKTYNFKKAKNELGKQALTFAKATPNQSCS